MNHVRQTHSDIIYLATLAAPVLVGIRLTDDSTSHDYAISTLTCADHIEFVTDMSFLMIPDAPVVVEPLVEEVLQGRYQYPYTTQEPFQQLFLR